MRALRKASSIVLVIEAIILAAAMMLTVGLIPFGLRAYAVMSGSMEPELPVGSMVYVASEVEGDQIHIGDIIAFDIDGADEAVCTHRVVDIGTDGKTLITKGDMNESPDAFVVSIDAVRGKKMACVPHLGVAIDALASNREIAIILVMGTLAINLLSHAYLSTPKTASEKKGTGWKTTFASRTTV